MTTHPKHARACDLLQRLVALPPVLPVSQHAGETYGAVRADLERRGEIIGNNDLWIAAHGLAGDLIGERGPHGTRTLRPERDWRTSNTSGAVTRA